MKTDAKTHYCAVRLDDDSEFKLNCMTAMSHTDICTIIRYAIMWLNGNIDDNVRYGLDIAEYESSGRRSHRHTFRLDDRTDRVLQQLSNDMKCSYATVIRYALSKLYSDIRMQ